MIFLETAADHEVVEAESTVLLHVAELEHKSIKDYLNYLKPMVKSPENILQPFHFSILLTLSGNSFYEKQVVQLVRSCIANMFHEEKKRSESCWFRQMVPRVTTPKEVMDQVIEMRFAHNMRICCYCARTYFCM